jgi:hypothetical protein
VKSRSVVLVTVTGPAGREDVVVASDVAVFQLLPALTAIVGGRPDASAGGWGASAAARWHLLHDGHMLAPTRSLIDAGVVDGHELRVTSEG